MEQHSITTRHLIVVFASKIQSIEEQDHDFRLRMWKIFQLYPQAYKVNRFSWIISSSRTPEEICSEISAALELQKGRDDIGEVIVAEVSTLAVLTQNINFSENLIQQTQAEQSAGPIKQRKHHTSRRLNKVFKRISRNDNLLDQSTGESIEEFMEKRGFETSGRIQTNIQHPWQGGAPGLGK
ncbi:MAG: hypothetical protein ACOYM3_27635 [Terrimicrobiaceae bacterium]